MIRYIRIFLQICDYALPFYLWTMISVNVHNLGKRYGSTTVFKNLSFRFDTGVLGIGGSNGSGKSTLLKCLAGLERVSSGTITWKQDEHQLSETDFRKRLGFVAPYINLYHELTVRENLDLVLQLRKEKISHQKKQELWNQLQLTGLEEKHFGELSTGQRQRARLACTLSYDPAILFLDEPGANLDEQGREVIRKILRNFRAEEKLVLLASNDSDELNLADSIFSVEQ